MSKLNCNMLNYWGRHNDWLQASQLQQQPGSSHQQLPGPRHKLFIPAIQAASVPSAHDLPYPCCWRQLSLMQSCCAEGLQ